MQSWLIWTNVLLIDNKSFAVVPIFSLWVVREVKTICQQRWSPKNWNRNISSQRTSKRPETVWIANRLSRFNIFRKDLSMQATSAGSVVWNVRWVPLTHQLNKVLTNNQTQRHVGHPIYIYRIPYRKRLSSSEEYHPVYHPANQSQTCPEVPHPKTPNPVDT